MILDTKYNLIRPYVLFVWDTLALLQACLNVWFLPPEQIARRLLFVRQLVPKERQRYWIPIRLWIALYAFRERLY